MELLIEQTILLFIGDIRKNWFIVSSEKVGPYPRVCPSCGGKVEAPGQSSAKSAILTATPVETESALSSLSIEQLGQQLAQWKLSAGVSEMQSASTDSADVHVVKANSVGTDVV